MSITDRAVRGRRLHDLDVRGVVAGPAEGSVRRQGGTPEYPSQWKTRYCIDSMLEHAVMHPVRHAFQLDELLKDL